MKIFCDCCQNTFPNDDEYGFHFWLVEAKLAGLIERWKYQYPTFVLSAKRTIVEDRAYVTKVKKIQKTKSVKTTILNKCTYTADFSAYGVSDSLLAMIPSLGYTTGVFPGHCFDVKPKFEKSHSRKEVFRTKQAWMLEKYDIFVHPVVPKDPEDFFHRTWVPEKLAFCLNGRRRKPFAKCRLVGEI
jgi:hypothetical protein